MGPSLHPGDIFAGYRIRGLLGHGGMGAVYAADHPRLPRVVAVKILTAAADDHEALARFDREAEMIARLDHPGIVAVLDRGVEQGIPWISMQFVQGSDAGATLRTHGPLPLAQVTAITGQTADALDYAHARGVLHRDVKPGNIMLESAEPGRALLTDFGIATVRDHSRDITSTGQSLATLDYASPEQLRGRSLDGSTDQYSLACTVQALLTGRPPFAADNVATVIQGHLAATPASVRVTRPDIAPPVSEVIGRALAKDPGERFGSCREFAQALRRAADPATSSPVTADRTTRRRRPAMMWGAGTAAALVLLGGGYGVSRTLGDGAAPPTSVSTPPVTTAGPGISEPTSTRMPTGGDDGPGSLAVWDAVRPAQRLWPDLLPQQPTGAGYSGLRCSALTKKTTGTMPQYTYRLNCAEPGGIRLEMLAYDTSAQVERLVDHYGDTDNPIAVRASNGTTLTVYKNVDPDTAKTWMLVQVQGDGDKSAYAFQLSGVSWKEQAAFVAAAPW